MQVQLELLQFELQELGLTAVVTVALLLDKSGSVIKGSKEVTEAVLVIELVQLELTVPLNKTVIDNPGSKRSKFTEPSQGSQVIPPSIEYSGEIIPVGRVYTSNTLSASRGPLLVITKV